jgi:hypothetical protein
LHTQVRDGGAGRQRGGQFGRVPRGGAAAAQRRPLRFDFGTLLL